MPSATKRIGYAPDLETFLDYIQDAPIESSTELLISLLKRRQIKFSRECAKATGYLLKEVVSNYEWKDVDELMEYVQDVGRRLCNAQPREMAIGNIVRRVLGMIRDELTEDRDETSPENTRPGSASNDSPVSDSPRFEDSFEGLPASLRRAQTSRPAITSSSSMFNLLAAYPGSASGTPPYNTTGSKPPINISMLKKRLMEGNKNLELKSEILSGIDEILDELSQVEDQIAAYGPDQIVEGECLLTYSASATVQKFLLKTAQSRKFTVFHCETFPNENEAVYDILRGKANEKEDGDELLSKEKFTSPLRAAGIQVVFCKDTQIVAMMCRINKVILSPHIVFANGGLLAATGAQLIAKAARAHRVPVIVLSGVYKLTPEFPANLKSLIEYGNPSKVLGHRSRKSSTRLDVSNPLTDYVTPELVSLYITNLGPCAPSYLYRVIADHYQPEDVEFNDSGELNL